VEAGRGGGWEVSPVDLLGDKQHKNNKNSQNNQKSEQRDLGDLTSGRKKSKKAKKKKRKKKSDAAERKKAQQGARVKLPSVSPLIEGLFKDQELEKRALKDRPEQHQGRMRSFKHVRGNWPTHVFMAVPATLISEVVTKLCAQAGHMRPSTQWNSMLESPKDGILHISLSRTVTLREHEILPFVRAFRAAMESTCDINSLASSSRKKELDEKGSSDDSDNSLDDEIGMMLKGPAKAFDVTMNGGIEFYRNDEKTRSFAAASLSSGKQSVLALITRTNAVMKKFSLPRYYKNPSPHMSFAWCLGDVLSPSFDSERDQKKLPLGEPSPLCAVVPVNEVYCKIGNKLFTVPLSSCR